MKLVEYNRKEISSGSTFRFKSEGFPFVEDYVDFMLVDCPFVGDDNAPFAVYCISGYCAGNLECVLPSEAQHKNSRTVDKDWLIKNWNKWIYSCPVEEVEIITYWS